MDRHMNFILGSQHEDDPPPNESGAKLLP